MALRSTITTGVAVELKTRYTNQIVNRNFDRRKTLKELGCDQVVDADFDSYLVAAMRQLLGRPVGDFSIEDIRIMIGQHIGLRWLVPIALEELERHPLAQGDFYPGDLLASLLRVPSDFWSREWQWRKRLEAVLEPLTYFPDELSDALRAFREQSV